MDVKPIVEALIKRNHEVLETTIGDSPAEVLHWVPPGIAHPIAALYAHVVTGEDMMFHRVLMNGQNPLYEGEWATKTGLSEIREKPGVSWDQWARRLRMDLAAFREYAHLIQGKMEAYVAAADEAEMARMVTPHIPGRPPVPAAVFITNIMCNHIANHAGEISTLKGLQGLKGYPF
ncbi:MAG: DinB family protein [Dehalococcoidia bacterium]|nr:DinB family protein [Dehalococcoidia bacterium]